MCKGYQPMKKVTLALLVAMLGAVSCSKKNEEQPKSTVKTDTTQSVNHGSIYTMDMTFENQKGDTVQWKSLKCKVQVMAMFFSHCPAACPIITEDIKKAEKLIPADEKKFVGFTLVSFDTKRDTVGRLQEYYREHSLDTSWQLLHGSAEDIRMIANMLNVKYKEWPGGDFTHDNLIFVIDENGGIALRREGLGGDPKDLAFKVMGLVEGVHNACSLDQKVSKHS